MEGDEAGGRTALEPADAHDVFISYAGEDRKLARRLKKELTARGLTVWFDETELVAGQSLRRSIDRGLAHSRAGAVILSQSFFRKAWPQAELDGLMTREKDEPGILVPVWHRLDAATVREYSLTLADKYALKTTDGVRAVADGIERALEMLAAGASEDATRRAAAAQADATRRAAAVKSATSRRGPGGRAARVSGAIGRYGADVWNAMGAPQVAYFAMILGTAALAFTGALIAAALLAALVLVWPLIIRRERLRVSLMALALVGLVAIGYLVVHGAQREEKGLRAADPYVQSVSPVITTLDAQRQRYLGGLKSRSLTKRADAASALADAHEAASRTLRALNTPPHVRDRARSLESELSAIAEDLEGVARAARNRDRAAANKSIARALRRDANLRDQLDSLRTALSAP